jgi:hypothetical protein
MYIVQRQLFALSQSFGTGRHIKSDFLSARNQDNVSEWSDMYIRGLLFPLANTMKKTKRVGLEKSGHHHHLINMV